MPRVSMITSTDVEGYPRLAYDGFGHYGLIVDDTLVSIIPPNGHRASVRWDVATDWADCLCSWSTDVIAVCGDTRWWFWVWDDTEFQLTGWDELGSTLQARVIDQYREWFNGVAEVPWDDETEAIVVLESL